MKRILNLFFVTGLFVFICACSNAGSQNILRENNGSENNMVEEKDGKGAKDEDSEENEKNKSETDYMKNKRSKASEITKYEWGTLRKDIEAAEITEDMVDGDDYGSMDTEISILREVDYYWMFDYFEFNENDELISRMYVMNEAVAEKRYVEAFLHFVEEYEKMFGNPSKSDFERIQRAKDDSESFANEIMSSGDALIISWEMSDKSVLNVDLCERDNLIQLIILYVEPNYYD